MPPESGRVLITDGILRAALAVCRALGSRGVEVSCADQTRLNPTFFSRYCSRRLTFPGPREDPDGFVETLTGFLAREPHELFIPLDPGSIEVVVANRERFEEVVPVALADSASFSTFWDKGLTHRLAERIGIPVPRTVAPSTPEGAVEESRSLRFPVVVKPRSSFAARGLRRARDERELDRVYRAVHRLFPKPLVQEEIPHGPKFGVGCLFDRESRPVATFAQEEVRGYPVQDGVRSGAISSLQRSVWRPDLVDLAVQLLDAARWYGIAEVEFMVDPRDGTPLLMEVNARFWASVRLAALCGVNFPWLLYRVARGETVEPVRSYDAGVLCRALLPYDLLHFLQSPSRWSMRPSFFGRYHGYYASRRDPGPALGFALSAARIVLGQGASAGDPETWERHALAPSTGSAA